MKKENDCFTDSERREFLVSMESMMPLIRERLTEGQSVRFSPRGTSMLPMLRQGIDSVVLSPLPERLKKYDLPLYQRSDGKYILHRVVKAGETYTCVGDNQFIREEGVTHDQMIALVTAFYRDGKAHSVDEVSYRMYCCFWHYSRPWRRLWRGLRRRLGRILR